MGLQAHANLTQTSCKPHANLKQTSSKPYTLHKPKIRVYTLQAHANLTQTSYKPNVGIYWLRQTSRKPFGRDLCFNYSYELRYDLYWHCKRPILISIFGRTRSYSVVLGRKFNEYCRQESIENVLIYSFNRYTAQFLMQLLSYVKKNYRK